MCIEHTTVHLTRTSDINAAGKFSVGFIFDKFSCFRSNIDEFQCGYDLAKFCPYEYMFSFEVSV